MIQNIEDWIYRYFEKKVGVIDRNGDHNYFEEGWIDSFGVIELIEELEAHFQIKFNEIQFADRRFSTVSGLSEIIELMLRQNVLSEGERGEARSKCSDPNEEAIAKGCG